MKKLGIKNYKNTKSWIFIKKTKGFLREKTHICKIFVTHVCKTILNETKQIKFIFNKNYSKRYHGHLQVY